MVKTMSLIEFKKSHVATTVPEASTEEDRDGSRSCDSFALLTGTMVTRVIGYCCSMVHSIKLLLGIHPRKQSGNLDFILFMEVANSFILSLSYRTAYQKDCCISFYQ